MIDIALCTDNNYAMPSGVMIHSVCRNSGAAKFHVIVPDDFSEDNKRHLIEVCKPFGAVVTFVTVPDEIVRNFPVNQENQPEHITIAAYYRLFLADLLPADMDKVLYLDCDLICLAPLAEFYNLDIADRPLSAISDIPYSGISEAVRLGYDEKYGYFNSGVLLINLAYWRKNNVRQLFLDFLKDHRDLIRYHDQDVLNVIFQGEVLFSHPKYNAQDRLFHLDTPSFPYTDGEVEEARQYPAIVHFTYKNKPWILGGTHPYQSYFDEYLRATPWKGIRLHPKKANDLKGRLVNLLVIMGIYKYHDDYISIS